MPIIFLFKNSIAVWLYIDAGPIPELVWHKE